MDDPTAAALQRTRSLLATLVRIAGLDRQALDEKLGEARGFTSQVLTGRVKLRFQHVLQILDVLQIEPAVFFSLLYPISPGDRERVALVGDLMERLRLAGFEVQPAGQAASPAAARDEEIARLVRLELERVLAERAPRGRGGKRPPKKRS